MISDSANPSAKGEVQQNPPTLFQNQIVGQWLNSSEAAAYLRISPKHLLNMTSDGRIPFYKFGRSNRYLRSELDGLLLAQARGVRK